MRRIYRNSCTFAASPLRNFISNGVNMA